MNGMNQLFMNNPVAFLQDMCVDNKAIEEGLAGARQVANLNAAKSGVFDLAITGGNSVRLMYAGQDAGYQIKNDAPIRAYWCPFLNGAATSGWVDVPRRNPQWRLVLTAAMQGCAFVITNSPLSTDHFRVFHNQHPGEQRTWLAIQSAGATQQYSDFSYERYGNPNVVTNAFNLLWRPPGRAWSYVSQSNMFVPRPTSTAITRDLQKPILDLPTGV
jgi:hypothetical protein